MCRKIVGTWILDPTDIRSKQIYGDISLEFTEMGDLTYMSCIEDKCQKIFMTYNIEGDILVTDQLSWPRKERTKFNVLSNGKLELEFDGVKSLSQK